LARDDCKDDADDDADHRYDIPDAKGHLKIPLTDEVESQKHTGCDDENAQQGKQHSDEVPNVPHPHIVARNVGVSENPDRATATEPASGFIEGFFFGQTRRDFISTRGPARGAKRRRSWCNPYSEDFLEKLCL
jgi:hypothetical protein